MESPANPKVSEMRLRDLFAVHAMAAFIQSEKLDREYEFAAIKAYGFADAMLAEREKPGVDD